MILLTSDWHLDDNPANEYRWRVWDHVQEQVSKGVRKIRVIGDLCEKKDKHSAALLNRVLYKINELCATAEAYECLHKDCDAFDLTFMLGNHDKPLQGAPYWSLLDALAAPCCFISEPYYADNELFLPYADDPGAAWAELPFDHNPETGEIIKVIYIHQTLPGVKAEGAAHRILDGRAGIPTFPQQVKVYSGDIHMPQTIQHGTPVVYVGAPHRVRYGDDHICRMLLLDCDTFEIAKELIIDAPLKEVVNISSVDEFKNMALQPGDQFRIQFVLAPELIESFAKEEAALYNFARAKGVTIAAIEPVIERIADGDKPITFDNDPFVTLREFAQAEGLDAGLIDAAEALLAEEGVRK